MSDNFTGRWLVTEYVYNPDGTFVGIVQQKRYLERLSTTHLRVIQDCEPSPALQTHPMREFAGHWEFDLHLVENQRQYQGDVVGTGYPYGADAMLGQGIWTRFGYNFTSFGFLIAPDTQLTGGAFYNVHQMMARIVGIACPETDTTVNQFPNLNHDQPLHTIGQQWHGTSERYDNQGQLFQTDDVTCNVDEQSFTLHNHAAETTFHMTYQAHHDRVDAVETHSTGTTSYFGKRKIYGCLYDEVLYASDGLSIVAQTIWDTASQTMVIIRQWHKAQTLSMTEILRLAVQ